MELASRVPTNLSTKSYLEREIIISLDNDGPMIGPTLETIETTDNQKVSNNEFDPRQFSRLKKNTILFVVAISSAMSPIASIIYFPSIITMQNYFNTDDTTMNASFTIFLFITALFPLIWVMLGNQFAMAGNIGCALSFNVRMFNGFRAISAMGSSSVLSMGAGTISDIFEPRERGRAFAYYYFGPLLGPALGPIIGGYLSQGLGWRSVFWFLSILALCIWLGIFFFLPETSKISSDFDKNEKIIVNAKKINPFASLKLLLYPNIAMTVTYVSVLFFMQYLNSTEFTRVYSNQYKLKSGTVGLCYLPYAVGAMAGGNIGGRFSDNIFNKRVASAKANGEGTYPEMRISGLIVAISAIIQLLSLTAYGWCVEKKVHFAYGLVCQFIYGIFFMLPNVTLGAYMVDCFRTEGAAVTACNNLARYIMAGIGSLISSEISKAIGDGPMFTLAGSLIMLFTILIYFIKRYYKKWAALRKT